MKRTLLAKSGFTLVEIMIVVAIIALLAAIAVPAFAKNRIYSRRSICAANLRQMENAKTVWAQENNKNGGDAPADSDLIGANKYLRLKPQCPADGIYSLNIIDIKASCTMATSEGHTL